MENQEQSQDNIQGQNQASQPLVNSSVEQISSSQTSSSFFKKPLFVILLFVVVIIVIGGYFLSASGFSPGFVMLPKRDLYLIQIRVKDGKKPHDGILERYIAKKLGIFTDNSSNLISDKINMKLYFDAQKYTYPGEEFQYIEFYLIPKNNLYPKYRKTSDDYAEIKATSINNNLLLYFENSKYCKTNSDCLVREEVCIQEAYNKYQLFFGAYGCEGPNGEYDAGADCYREVAYHYPRCEKNLCVADKSVSNTCEIFNH